MKNIGVTGLFLSGKSTFSKLLSSQLKAIYFSADDYVHQLYTQEKIRKIIIDSFGEKVYKGRVLQRQLIANLVFNSENDLKKLESILHPEVEKEIQRLIQNKKGVTVFEVPLLYEKKLNPLMDINILVRCDQKILESRLEKQNINREQFEKRIKWQMSDGQKLKYNPKVINNNGSLEKLLQSAKKIAQEINN